MYRTPIVLSVGIPKPEEQHVQGTEHVLYSSGTRLRAPIIGTSFDQVGILNVVYIQSGNGFAMVEVHDCSQ
jgi:hypothetical protein